MRIISVVNQKGGVGKTTTVANLGAALVHLKKSVMLLDLDPQADLTAHFGFNPDDLQKTMVDVFRRNYKDIRECVLVPKEMDIGIIPSSGLLSSVELDLADIPSRETQLADRLKDIKQYDFVLIDSPPSLGFLSINGLAYAKEIIIPLQVEFFALKGMLKLLETVAKIKHEINPGLKTTGIIATMYDQRTSLSHDILKLIKDKMGNMVFSTIIRDNVRLAEAPSFGKAIFEYSADSYGAEDYLSLAKEVINRG